MRVEVATVILSVVLALLLAGCAGRGDKPNEITKVQVVYRDRLVPAPCAEKVTKPKDPLISSLIGPLPEDSVDALILSDSVNRQYIPSLERAAKACGVTIAN